jgi:hypothetical protein
MDKFVGDRLGSLSCVHEIGKQDGWAPGCEANGCGRMFFSAPMTSPARNHLYSDPLNMRRNFVEKPGQFFRF